MSKTIVVGPDKLTLGHFCGQNFEEANVKFGALAENLGWADEQNEQIQVEQLICHPQGSVKIVFVNIHNDATTVDTVQLLLPSLACYSALHLNNKTVSDVEVKQLFAQWTRYFQAIQQLLLTYPELFSAVNVAFVGKSVLLSTIQSLLMSDDKMAQIHLEWSTFVSNADSSKYSLAQSIAGLVNVLAEKTSLETKVGQQQKNIAAITATAAEHDQAQQNTISSLEQQIKQYEVRTTQLNSQVSELSENQTKRESEFKRVELLKEASEQKLIEQSQESELLNLQVAQLQEELESQHKQVQHMQQLKMEEIDTLNTQAAQQVEELEAELMQQRDALKQSQHNLAEFALRLETAEQGLLQKDSLLSEVEQKSDIQSLQITQLQEELETQFIALQKSQLLANTSATELKKAQHESKKIAEDGQSTLNNQQAEIELLTLQIAQLQEELEYYFIEFNKLASSNEIAVEQELTSYKQIVQQRYPYLVEAKNMSITGGFDQSPNHRLIVKLHEVQNFEQSWSAFSFVINDRNGVVDIEFHEPSSSRVYPLSTFIKTGTNKVCDYSIISPYSAIGLSTYMQLPLNEQGLLRAILSEVLFFLKTENISKMNANNEIELSLWVAKITNLIQDLQKPALLLAEKAPEIETVKSASQTSTSVKAETKELSPSEEPLVFEKVIAKETSEKIITAPKQVENDPSSSLRKVTLLQNMVASSNEHLTLQLDKLKIDKMVFPSYQLKVGAKQIKTDSFTLFGSLEFREQKNQQAALPNWQLDEQDKWGPKLVLDFGPELTIQQKNKLDNLTPDNRLFVMKLLSLIAKNLHKVDLNERALNQPLANWHQLIMTMISVLNEKPLDLGTEVNYE
ncbi:hypothetical protein [Paraglaciecola sp. 25GB23A]|uniref:hypothetical protein n=1 Tax=Paraglaciecola sp. 25GB23A TaxID=3156068 RepID=UPI0032AF2855